jgi:endoglucanase
MLTQPQPTPDGDVAQLPTPHAAGLPASQAAQPPVAQPPALPVAQPPGPPAKRPPTGGVGTPRGSRTARSAWAALFSALTCLFVLAGPARAELAIHVRGNQLVNGEGRAIRLLGVNFSGAEYACVQDRGIWSAPTDEAAIAAMVAWHIDVVRIPLNEDCWLGIDGAPAQYSGSAYQQAIHEFVQALHNAGLYAILDLQWSAPGANQASGLQQMADAEHSIEFWSSLAHSFREDPAVLFDLYSEPHEIGWECWDQGCTLPWSGGGTWQTAGMQAMVDAVRAQGATQPLLLGGIDWANDLSGWLSHVPVDPQHQLVASVHEYSNKGCASAACWQETLAPIAERYPVVAGEVGEFDCGDQFIDQFMNWADANDISYLGWTWNTFDCETGPALIANTEGVPTAFGQGLFERLRTPRIALEVAPSPAAPGQPLTLTAQVWTPTYATTPGGSVTFQVDGAARATQTLDASGQATLTLARLSSGVHKLRVLYSGDETLQAGAGEMESVDVLPEEPPPTPLSPPPVLSAPHASPPPARTPQTPAVSTATGTAATPKPASAHRRASSRPHKTASLACSPARLARARGARRRALRAHCEARVKRNRPRGATHPKPTRATSPSGNSSSTSGR